MLHIRIELPSASNFFKASEILNGVLSYERAASHLSPQVSTPMTATERVKTEVWASNALFFAGTHVLALLVLWLYPPSMLQTSTVVMLPLLWNAAMFGQVSYRACKCSLTRTGTVSPLATIVSGRTGRSGRASSFVQPLHSADRWAFKAR